MGVRLTTFLFEIVNFVVLTWLLQRLLYKPLRSSLDERRARAEEREKGAAAALDGAQRLEHEYAEKRRELDALRDGIVRQATEEAAAERARILRSARDDAAAEHARVQRLLQAEREAATAWVMESAVEQSTRIAGKLLARLAPKEVDGALLARLLEEIAAADRAVLKAGVDAEGSLGEVEVTFAHAPVEDHVALVRSALEEIFGTMPPLAIREDSALECGVRIRFGGRTYDASVAGQLDAFRHRARNLLTTETAVG